MPPVAINVDSWRDHSARSSSPRSLRMNRPLQHSCGWRRPQQLRALQACLEHHTQCGPPEQPLLSLAAKVTLSQYPEPHARFLWHECPSPQSPFVFSGEHCSTQVPLHVYPAQHGEQASPVTPHVATPRWRHKHATSNANGQRIQKAGRMIKDDRQILNTAGVSCAWHLSIVEDR